MQSRFEDIKRTVLQKCRWWIFLHDIRWLLSDIYKHFQAMFSSQIFEYLRFFIFYSQDHPLREYVCFYFACLSLNLTLSLTFT